MVEANSNQSMESGSHQGEDTEMADEVEIVKKPRNNYSNSALRRVVPQTDLKKKKENLTQSMINMGSSGRTPSRLFNSSSNVVVDGATAGRHCSFNSIKK